MYQVIPKANGSMLVTDPNKFDLITLWTMEGTLLSRIESHKLVQPRSFHALDENNMILADQNGRFMVKLMIHLFISNFTEG